MPNSFYKAGSFPATGSPATSASMRAELALIAGGFDKLPTLAGNGYKLVAINSTGTAVVAGGQISSADFTTTGIADAVARLTWNDADGTLNLGLKGGNTVLRIGQEEVLRVLNTTGSTITSGQAVYIVGASGQRPTVALAQANAEATSTKVIGFAVESIANNQQGFVVTAGMVRGINTSAFAEGAVLWLSASVAGGITSTKPTPPNHSVLLGYCVRSNASDGIVYVLVQNGYELDELHDVLISSLANNNMLRYNSTLGVWQNIAGPAGAVVGTTDTQTLTNKTISGASNALSNIGNASLVNSSVTIGSTAVALGATATTIAGLTSVTSTTFVGALTGNASTATTLQTSRTIWGQSFNGSANVTGALTGVTTIDASGAVTLSAGTANGVAYLNASKVLTTGSALVFDGSNLGLGVTPSAWSTSGNLQLKAGSNISAGTGIGLYSNSYFASGWKYIDSTLATGYGQSGGSHLWYTAPSGTAGNAITFTQAMTLDASGNLLVGTTSASGFANGLRLLPTTDGGSIGIGHPTGTVTGSGYILFGFNGTGIGSIAQNGTTAVAYNTTSDYRLKEDVRPMTGALAKVAALKPVTYKWKSDGSDGDGFIAHELQAVVPHAVTGEKDAVDAEGKPQYQSIDTSFLVATLTAALQEQQALITSLTARIAALEA